ncbi:hypothetical protein FSP39_005416 [Pinctada imbricata]|uniref:MYCBP-associated protein n=1 Tax=Pinctada imbricata TaxID=66713 RepID=A0AA88XYY7_PINIB|nr:hypothetical protein FSP39_005416 [Pinctada imbricata]
MGKEDHTKESRRLSKDHSHRRDRRYSVLNRDGHKLKGKKNAPGTPDKSGTPSQDAGDDNQSPTRNVIWNEEIEKLQIKEDDLKNLREVSPPGPHKSPKTDKVIVKKMKPLSEINKPKPKIVTVAKPAPPDAPVKVPDYSGFAGPRYDRIGDVIPHSLLGSYDDFHREAIKRGDLLDLPEPRGLDIQEEVPTVKYEKKQREKKERRDHAHANENNALRNWQLKMMERKRQQGYISKLLQKNPEDLAMNAADNYRKIQEERYIIDRTIPAMDYGKGYRVGSEFWKQQERFGDDETGIHMTLTQTERGYPRPVEHVGLSKSVRQEKGWHWPPYHTTPVHYPWHKNPYLEERKKQLQPVIDELDPHKPDFDGLEIIGTANPVERQRVESNIGFIEEMREEDEKLTIDDDELDIDPMKDGEEPQPETIFGPSITFAGQPARWTGDSSSFADQVGIEARVTFESYSSDRVTSYLYIVNDGTTAVYYDWKKLPKDNPFDLVHAHVQRFYFNNSSGVILPGETMKFPFVFKSPNAGVFTEQWKFETRPRLCGGASLIVTLRGIALQEDKFKVEREELERDLQQKQADQVVRQIMYDIISGIKTPDRPSSPVDAYITDEEIFSRNNPKLHYNHESVQELKQLYSEIAPEEERAGRIWDLSIQDLKDEILCMDEEDERKENFLHQLNTTVSKMSYCQNQPTKKNLYKVGYELLVEMVDGVVRESAMLRKSIGLPEKDPEEFAEDQSDARSKKAEKTAKPVPDKKAPPPKDPKAAKGGKETAKAEPKGKTPVPAKKPASSRGPSATPGPGSMLPPDRERTHTPTSGTHSPMPADVDPVLFRKYKQKLLAQTYLMVGDTMDQMERVFEEVLQSEERPPLSL